MKSFHVGFVEILDIFLCLMQYLFGEGIIEFILIVIMMIGLMFVLTEVAGILYLHIAFFGMLFLGNFVKLA
jgi:hypothetical protein